jgi:glyoxylase-like metal-dependent hydrolase (beta-lactamase superfamily II)
MIRVEKSMQMNNRQWFTVTKINSTLFVISELHHWEKPNMYLIIGEKRAMLIDTGLGVCNLYDKIKEITNLPIIVVITHAHWDHIGSISSFTDIAIHSLDQPSLEVFPLPKSVVINNLIHGNNIFPDSFKLENYQICSKKPTVILNDSDLIDLGNRTLQVIHTPGHSPGHICLYEEKTGYLFTGDLVYEGKLDMFYPTTNPIDFYNSIKKIESLRVSYLFPGHFRFPLEFTLIKEISSAFAEISRIDPGLKKAGVFNFSKFSIHI